MRLRRVKLHKPPERFVSYDAFHIWRGETRKKLIIAHDDVVVEDQDLLVVFATGQEAVRRLEKLLQVGVSFI